MSTVTSRETIRIALVGNPNTGKSTLFNMLAGVQQRVGNYPGVTVEKKIGCCRHGDADLELIDLPGTYSLAPRSPDEMVAVDVLLGRTSNHSPPDVILSIIDGMTFRWRNSLAARWRVMRSIDWPDFAASFAAPKAMSRVRSWR